MGGIDCDFHPHSLAGASFPCKETLFLLEHAKDEIARQYEEGNGVVSQEVINLENYVDDLQRNYRF